MFFAYVYITRVYKLLLFSFCYFSLSFFSTFRFCFMNAFSRVDSSSLFFLICLRFLYIFYLAVFPFLFPFSLYLTPLLLSYTPRLVTSYFFFSRPSMRWNFRFPLISFFSFVSSSFLLFVRRLYRSLSIRRRSRCRFLYCICSLVSSLLSCSGRGSDAFPGFPRT